MHGFQSNEKSLSQIPALLELINLGYRYLTPAEAYEARDKKLHNVLLENILREQIQNINRIHHRGGEYRFSEENVQAAIQKIKHPHYDGLLRTNEHIYDLLTLGTALAQSIEGDSRSFTLNYVDWQNPRNNTFHVTAEFPVERMRSTETARPDIVLFVNGIPFAVIESKAPDIAVDKGVLQMIRNQKDDYIPRLFVYVQLLVSINKNNALYATVGTAPKFWGRWREQEDGDEAVERAVHMPLADDVKAALFSGDFAGTREHFEALGKRQITEQDRAIYSLCRPERLLELTRLFTVFDAGQKKIARYQQFFVVRSALERVRQMNDAGRRKGGMIWHTQGSGKSLTMVWLARLIATDDAIKNPEIVMVTDRTDLDKQIEKVFRQCGIDPQRATTGRELLKLIQSHTPVVTTLVHKFDKALKADNKPEDRPNIFVLVDESHRTQFAHLAARMRQMLPNACYIGFTGTPLTREQKNNFVTFGGLIEPSYPVRQALEDNAIVPLLYEGRYVETGQDPAAIDLWFGRHTADLNEKQKADLKEKYSRANAIKKADRVVYMHAFDISDHYRANWQGTGLKAQLVAQDKATAIRYHNFLREIGSVSSEVVISSPDMREGFEEVDGGPTSEVRMFWDDMMKRFGSEKRYTDTIIERFKTSERPEILIVVDKLLTGFDAPVNTVLYLCKPLREHTLLQAIARVNRLHDGKQFGYVVDYVGILGELDRALASYDAMQGFDEDDLEQTLMSIKKQIEKLPQRYSHLWDLFKAVANRKDEEAYERFLGDDAQREEFRVRLADYANALAIALSSHKFLMDTDEHTLRRYKEDLRRFEKLRRSVGLRYADAVDYSEHEPKIRKLLDTHIQADTVTQITKPMNIYTINTSGQGGADPSAETEPGYSEATRADRIAHLLKRTISEKMEQDPVLCEQFSTLIQKAIDDFRQSRISESDYLKTVSGIHDRFHNRRDDNIPKSVRHDEEAAAFFRVLQPLFAQSGRDGDLCDTMAADTALAILGILQRHSKVHFWDDQDARNAAMNDIEDYLYDEVQKKGGLDLHDRQMDEILDRTMRIARHRACT